MTDKIQKSAPTLPTMTTRSERLNYWLYFLGQSMSYTMLGGFLTTYMMMVGVDLDKIALAMVAVKLWDSVNDTIFGIIFDKVKFKSGNKSLPWIRMTLALIPLTTLFIYLIPSGLDTGTKLVWFIVAYLLWDAAYTLSDIPIYNLATALTTNLVERNSILSIARIYALAGAFITSMLTTFLVSERVGLSFGLTAVIVVIFVILSMLPIALKGQERIKVQSSEESYTVARMFKYLRNNKYLFLYYSGYILSGIFMTNAAIDLFVSYYLFGSALFSTFMLVMSALPMIVISLLIQKILKKIDKFKLFYWSNVLFVLFGLAVWLGGYQKVWLYVTLVVLRSIPQGFMFTLNLTFTPDIVEYGRFKTGVDARGVAFAFQSFAAKLTSLAQPLGLFILGLFGWITIKANSFAVLKALHITQTPQALHGLWFTATLIPVIGVMLALIPYSFYKLNDHDVQIMARFNANEITLADAKKTLSRSY
ncbi:MAG: MFS transporter [Lactobacillus sp.]|jgi:Na+/melibiose symporter-like transporter|nr:MFS transporter [Lactobacillus sp.]